MASVLDACRGVRSKDTTQFIAMPDNEYAFYLNEVRSLPKKQQRKWKRHNEKTDGSTSTIWSRRTGILYAMVEPARIIEVAVHGSKTADGARCAAAMRQVFRDRGFPRQRRLSC